MNSTMSFEDAEIAITSKLMFEEIRDSAMSQIEKNSVWLNHPIVLDELCRGVSNIPRTPRIVK